MYVNNVNKRKARNYVNKRKKRKKFLFFLIYVNKRKARKAIYYLKRVMSL